MVTFNLSSTGNLIYWFCMLKFGELLDAPDEKNVPPPVGAGQPESV